MLRFAQHQTKSLVAGGLSFERFIEDLFNEDTSNVPRVDRMHWVSASSPSSLPHRQLLKPRPPRLTA